MEYFNWRVVFVVILASVIGYVTFNVVGGYTFEAQPQQVYEQYQSDEGVDIFLVYYADKDEIVDPQALLDEFSQEFPDYKIIKWVKVVKVRLERTYEVLVIYGQKR